YPLPPSLEASTFYNDKSMVEEHCRELELFVWYLLSFSSDQAVWKLVVSKFLQLDEETTSSLAFVGDSAGHPDIRQALYGYRPSSPLLSPSHDHQVIAAEGRLIHTIDLDVGGGAIWDAGGAIDDE
ncbi:hypothetical protein Pmar_PMAR010478, partial [Perkinsus marinus ATCC 50983]